LRFAQGANLKEINMLPAKRVPQRQAFTGLPSQIKGMIQDDIDLLELASRLSVKPGTVRKIISGRPVSSYVKMKLHTMLKQDGLLERPLRDSPVQELRELNRLYQELGTLRAVGEKVGLCRERVRQLLSKGDRIGLFVYRPKKRSLISRKKILSDYRKYLNLGEVAKVNKISLPYLAKLRTLHKIGKKDLHPMQKNAQRRECIDAYTALRERLGHSPSTSELQKMKKGRYLEKKIHRLWGSFSAFRKEFSIPSESLCS